MVDKKADTRTSKQRSGMSLVDEWLPAKPDTVTRLMKAAAKMDTHKFREHIISDDDPTAVDSRNRNAFVYALHYRFSEEARLLGLFEQVKIEEDELSRQLMHLDERLTEIANCHSDAVQRWKKTHKN